ncbi:MAG: ribonuclease HII [Proteobacteria bacterium]|nr:ribonuclease HII [Pseudomonadota bacterium]
MPDLDLEQALRADGFAAICGVDEAGRGPWAGPVVAAAVILPARITAATWAGLDDSKKLKPAVRERLFDIITAEADAAVGIVDVDEIDRLNILGATLKAMAIAIGNLKRRPGFALIDGNRPPELSCPVRTVVRGDAKSLSIAAASVVAKVTRDRIMQALARDYPGYGWARNAGYGTPEHIAALTRLGPTPVHRRSFAPIRKILRGDSG